MRYDLDLTDLCRNRWRSIAGLLLNYALATGLPSVLGAVISVGLAGSLLFAQQDSGPQEAVQRPLQNEIRTMRQVLRKGRDAPRLDQALITPNRRMPNDVQPAGIGPFAGQGDIGKVKLDGNASYDPQRQCLELVGAGSNMWFGEDQCHFVWKRLRGDFIVRMEAKFVGDGVEAHRKLGWMVRSNLRTDAPHVSAVVHGDGLTSLQYRRSRGQDTEELKAPVDGAEVIQLQRQGNRYTMSVARRGELLQSVALPDLPLGNEVFVGLFVCSHNPDVRETALFHNIRVVVPARDDFVPYRDYIGSQLETVDVTSGRRRIIYNALASLQAPNWTPDGKSLIYNSDGALFRFELAGGKIAQIDTGFANRNNNDHVISFDGRMIGISHHSAEDGGKSIVYVVPINGGTPRRITKLGPSYLHGWSPNGRQLVYTGERNGEFDIYQMAANGGEEVRLTDAKGLDDGAEYSPDGRHICFCSNRSGRMQIWRMRPDGTQPEQLTSDSLNNWFPHVSPDGKSIVFLSFSQDVDPGDHPFYKQVYLRSMPVSGGPARVIAYVYGGQGTINVPSWSPDGKQVAFVSNTDEQ